MDPSSWHKLVEIMEGWWTMILASETSAASMPECVAKVMPELKMMARGIFALLNPRPCHLGSSLVDVQFVMPPTLTKTKRTMGDLCVKSRTMMNAMRDSRAWQHKNSSYKASVSLDKGLAEPFQQLEQSLSEMSADCGDDHRRSVVHLALHSLPDWRSNLRPGATDHLEGGRLPRFPTNEGLSCVLFYRMCLGRPPSKQPSDISVNRMSPAFGCLGRIVSSASDTTRSVLLSFVLLGFVARSLGFQRGGGLEEVEDPRRGAGGRPRPKSV